MQPLFNYVLVKRSPGETVKGGIIIPDTAKEKPQRGVVRKVGPGIHDEKGRKIPMSIKVGDEVYFSPYAGIEVPNDEDLLFLKEDEILAKREV